MDYEKNRRIRKNLIDFLEELSKLGKNTNFDKWSKSDCAEWVAWVEKQGEQNIVVVIPKFRVGDVIRPKGSAAEYTIESISGECYHGKGWGLHISCDDDYELVEQKPWSEEDEQLYNDLSDTFFYNDEDYPEETYKLMLKRVLDWMTKRAKSLRPQKHWKPSDKQMVALDGICSYIRNKADWEISQDTVSGLYKLSEQLKKL